MSKQLKLPTILLVSENQTIRAWIKKHLDDRFFLIYAESRQETFASLDARLDFIILDASLESCDALALCQDISKAVKKSLVPIFLITGRLKKSYRDKAHQCGVTDFLSDQLDLDELEMRITAGQKTASAREKISDLSASIQLPKMPFPTQSLKHKFVLNDQGLKLLAEAKMEEKPVALLVLRIDHFSDLETPNKWLKPLTELLLDNLSKQDVLIPSTDGKFILLLSNTELDAAKQIAAKLREKVRLHPFNGEKEPQRLTVSIAVSALKADEKGFSNMIDSAIKSFKARAETNLIISLDQELS